MKLVKRIVVSLSIVSLFACLTACGAQADPVKEDLYSYLSQMEEIQPVQQEAINTYNTYVNDPESDSQELLDAMNDTIIPSYQTYIDQLNAITPETEEVQAVKQVCVDGANKQYEALNKVVEAIEACDTNMLAEADTLIAESESIFSDYENQLSTLAAEHEISLVSSRTGADSSEEETDSEPSDSSVTESEDTEAEATDAEVEE